MTESSGRIKVAWPILRSEMEERCLKQRRVIPGVIKPSVVTGSSEHTLIFAYSSFVNVT